MKKLKIGIDIDNVIADTTVSYLSEFNAHFGTSIKFEEVTDFYHIETIFSKSKAQVDKFLESKLHRDEFMIRVPPILPASDFIQIWLKKGMSVYYISARPKNIQKVTKKWLVKHGFWWEGAKLYTFDTDKNYTDIEYKTGIAKFEKLDIFIEDKKDIAEAMDIPVALLDRPWNSGALPRHVKRVYSWEEINKFIDDISSSSR